jgi:hypothetical protein
MVDLELGDTIGNRRFRFAFLDGCTTADFDLMKRFGADECEFQLNYAQLGEPPAQTEFPRAFYDAKGLRPAAFLGWGIDTPAMLPLDPAVEGCEQKKPEPVCFMRGEIARCWSIGDGQGPMTLHDAIDTAKCHTIEVFGTGAYIDDWTPETIALHGFKDLHCTELERKADWP